MSKTVKNVLYELIPLRPQDAYKIGTYMRENVGELLSSMVSGLYHVTKSARRLSLFYWCIGSAWTTALCIVLRFFPEFVKIFVVVTSLVLMLFNLDKKKNGDVSAYSVFNNFQRLVGAAEEQLEREQDMMMNRRRE